MSPESLMVAVGMPYPLPNQTVGQFALALHRTASAFNLQCYVSDLTPEEIVLWQTGPMLYGLFTDKAQTPYSSLPMLGFYFSPDLLFDAGFNMRYDSSDGSTAEEWLNSTDGNVVMCFLIDAKTNITLAIRAMGVSHEFMNRLRVCMKMQLDRFGDRQLIDNQTAEFQRLNSPSIVLKYGTFYAAGDASGQPIKNPVQL